MNNLLPTENYITGDNEHYLKNSLMYIIHSLVYYPEKKIEFKNSKLLFQSGELNGYPKLLFTIMNAQKKKDEIRAKNEIATALQYCSVIDTVNNDFCCLIVDEMQSSEEGDEVAALFGITSVEEDQPKLLDSVRSLRFFNKEKLDQFIKQSKNIDEGAVTTLREEKLLKGWMKLVIGEG